jgi:hypothetical protein
VLAQDRFEPPVALAAERYTAIWERAPFTKQTVGAAPGPNHSFAENFALAGLSDVGGQITVYLKDKISGEYTKITNQAPSESGIAFEKIVEHPDPKLVKVRLIQGNESAEVGYALEQTAAPAAGGNGPPAAAGALGARPPGAAAQRPGASPQRGGAPSGGGAGPATDPTQQQKSRRRIIMPQSPPQASARPRPLPEGGLVEGALSVPLALASIPAANLNKPLL